MQHTQSSWHTEYTINQGLHRLKINYLPVPASCSSAMDHVVFDSLHSPNFLLTYEQSQRSCCTSLPIYHLQVLLSSGLLMVFMCIAKLPPWLPRSESQSLLVHGFQGCLQTHCNTAPIGINKLAQLQSLSLHNHGLQVHLQTRSSIGFECFSTLTGLWPPSASRYSLDLGLLRCISNLAQSWPQIASPSSLNHSIQLNLQTHWIMASRCSSEITRSQSPVNVNVRMITVWWNSGARLRSAHHHHSTASLTASDRNAKGTAVFAQGPYKEGRMISRYTQPW